VPDESAGPRERTLARELLMNQRRDDRSAGPFPAVGEAMLLEARSSVGGTVLAVLAALLPAACSSERAAPAPAPALCTLDEEGQLKVYAASGSGPSAPLRSYGDRVGLGSAPWQGGLWDRRGQQSLVLTGDEVGVPAEGGLKTFSRRAAGNVAPSRTVQVGAAYGEALASSSGEVVTFSSGESVFQSLYGLRAGALASGQRPVAPSWKLDFGSRYIVSAALDEARDQLVVVLGGSLATRATGDWDANGIHTGAVLRGYRRGATDPTSWLWEVDLSAESLSLGPIAVDQAAGLLYVLGWAPSAVPGQWGKVELLVLALGDGGPVRRSRAVLEGVPVLGNSCGCALSASEIAYAGTALQLSPRRGQLLLGLSGGRLLGLDASGRSAWVLETRAAETDAHLAAFVLDDAAGALVVLRDHFEDAGPLRPTRPGRRSLAFYSYEGTAPSLDHVIDGALSAAARPGGLLADPESGEVLLTATSPTALTTFSIDAPDGAPALRSARVASLGAPQTFTGVRDGRGHLWALADGSLQRFDDGGGPVAAAAHHPQTADDLLADTRRGELWLTAATGPDFAAVTSVYTIAGDGLALARTYSGQQGIAMALDDVRGEVWTGVEVDYYVRSLSAFPVAAAQGAAPRLTLTLRGPLLARPAVDPRRGELYVHVWPAEGAPGADPSDPAAHAIDVYDEASGELLRTLTGLAPSAMAICR
jgi:hypothetical protein